MNLIITVPDVDRLDATVAERQKQLTRPAILRKVETETFAFTKTTIGLTVRYCKEHSDRRGHSIESMEIIKVSPKRYALVQTKADTPPKWLGNFEASLLWTALREFRREARWAREDKMRAEIERDWWDTP